MRDIYNNTVQKRVYIDPTEILPQNFISTLNDPDKERINEATGNEGTSMERWYNRLALLIVPISQLYHLESFENIIAKFQVRKPTSFSDTCA